MRTQSACYTNWHYGKRVAAAALLFSLGCGADPTDFSVSIEPARALEEVQAPVMQATLPAVADPAQRGPFAIDVVATAPGLTSHGLFVPKDLGRDGIKHPIVVWTNGNGGSISFYRAFLEHLASHGFFVVADKASTSDHPRENKEQVRGIDWAVAQANGSGPYAGKIDETKIAIMGHSLGSLASFANAGDPRIATSVHWSGGLTGNPAGADESALKLLHRPAAFFCGGTDTMAGPACAKDFEQAPKSVPVFYGKLAGVGHLGVFGNRNGGEYGRVGVAWLRLQLVGDETFRPWFTGTACKVCTRPWTGLSRNLEGPVSAASPD
jgi:dienelactone hydrolase